MLEQLVHVLEHDAARHEDYARGKLGAGGDNARAEGSTPLSCGICTSHRITSYQSPGDQPPQGSSAGSEVAVTSNSSSNSRRSDSLTYGSSSTMSTRATRGVVPEAWRAGDAGRSTIPDR